MPATMYSLTNYLRPSNHQDTSCGQNRIIFGIADASVPLLLLQRGIGKYVPRYSRGEQQHGRLHPQPLVDHRHHAIPCRQPHQGDRYDLHAQRNGTVFSEIADVGAQFGVVHQPPVQPRRAAHEEPRRQQQKRRGGEQRQKYARYTQHERHDAEKRKECFHRRKINHCRQI